MPDRFTVAFTGTQLGMSLLQQGAVGDMLAKLRRRHGERLYAVHGDCVGADAMFDGLCVIYRVPRGIYPANIEKKRSHSERRGAEVLAESAPPLERNVLIVTAGDLLVATPKGYTEEQRSGTWATVRRGREIYAEQMRGAIVIAWPNGAADFDFPTKRPAKICA